MARPPQNQKQIAENYKGSLDYTNKPHLFRRVRLICFVAAVVISIVAVVGFRHFGGDTTFFSAGPLSAKHSRFADKCEVCHDDAHPVFMGKLTSSPLFGAKDESTRLSQAELIQRNLQENTSMERLDKACIHCHEPQSLHQPQGTAEAVRKISVDLTLVQSGSCSSCHREHQGPGPMKEPDNDNCSSCHGNLDQQKKNIVSISSSGGVRIPPEGLISDKLGDGIRRFFPPVVSHEPAVFKRFDTGHPSFGYETPGAKDTAKIRYNHERHEQADVKLKGRQLECADCHVPGPSGVYMRPIKYDDHCARCHSLQFDPDYPKLLVPHRDADKVHDFLRSLKAQYLDYVTLNSPEMTDAQRQDFINARFSKLLGTYGSYAKLDEVIFKTGNPALDYDQAATGSDRVTGRSNKDQFVIGCNKCHPGVTSPVGNSEKWTLPTTNMAERWLTHGPFTHAPHVHMSCVDCHGAGNSLVDVAKSRNTSDILMPTQKSCAECHRPLDEFQAKAAVGKEVWKKSGPELVAQQRKEGGIASDCQSCHPKYHTTERDVRLLGAAGLR